MDPKETKEKNEKPEGERDIKIYLLPSGIQIKEVDIPSPQYPSDFPTIEFYPNGGSNGGSILLNDENKKGYKVDVHFLTGLVKVERAEDL